MNTEKIANRWVIAVAGVAVQMILGTVYAWSVFKKPIVDGLKWDEFHVGITFALTIFFLGLSAAVGGRFVDKAGTRKVAAVAAVLFGVGTMLGGLAVHTGQLWLLWLGYGVIAGIGNGLGYVTPVAVLVRWFPDKKGFITGLAVMGFGLGAAFMSIIGAYLTGAMPGAAGVSFTFLVMGAVFLVALLLASRKLVNPPPDWSPQIIGLACEINWAQCESVTLDKARTMPQLYILWAILFLNVTAGIGLLSNLSPMAGKLCKPSDVPEAQAKIVAAAGGAAVVLAASFCNGFGRLFWGTLSEKLGRQRVFVLIFATQVPLFLVLPHVTNYWLFAAIACYILLCYGGGFGTMPSFTADTFGARNMGSIYGLILLAWGVAGGVGPTLMEWVRRASGNFTTALYIAAGVLTLGLVTTLLYRRPKVV